MSSPIARVESDLPGQDVDARLAKEILRIRFSQLIINEKYKGGEFRIPIHLALGHESIAVAVSEAMEKGDQLVLPHRNLHYNLARGASVRQIIDEFLLKGDGLAGGGLGSMNLVNKAAGIVYTSSVLGNNLSVATGVALARKLMDEPGITIVVLGDGGIEEGSFYEALLMMASLKLPALVIVENNGWSLATRIEERRGSIDLASMAEGLGGRYARLAGNDPYEYTAKLTELRAVALSVAAPLVVEVPLSTLGSWLMPTEEFPNGKYINYHAGPAPKVELSKWPLLSDSDEDPLFVVAQRFDDTRLQAYAEETLAMLQEELQ